MFFVTWLTTSCAQVVKIFFILFRQRFGSTSERPILVFRISELLSDKAWFDGKFAYRAQDKD